MENKTIIIVIYSFDVGGTERVTVDLVNHLVELGYAISIICIRKQGVLLSSLHVSNDHIYELCSFNGITVFNMLQLVKSLNKILKKIPFGPILAMGEIPNIIVPLVNNKYRKVIVEHSTKTLFSAPKEYNAGYGINFFARIAYKKADTILVVSENIKQILVQQNKKLEDKIKVVFNPLNYKLISVLSNESISENISINSNIPCIIAVGRLTKEKNFALLLKSLSTVLQSIECKLYILGIGPEENNLKELARELKIEKNVTFLGYDKNPYKYMAKADLFVSTSNYEGFSLVHYESVACGLRLVTTNSVSDFKNIFTDEYGVVVEVNDEKAITNAIRDELLAPRKVPQEKRVFEFLTLECVAQKYLNALLGDN